MLAATMHDTAGCPAAALQPCTPAFQVPRLQGAVGGSSPQQLVLCIEGQLVHRPLPADQALGLLPSCVGPAADRASAARMNQTGSTAGRLWLEGVKGLPHYRLLSAGRP